MKKFCITYDLIGKKKDYDGVNEIFENLNAKHILGSVWTHEIKNDEYTCKYLAEELLYLLDEYDVKLYVAEITDSHDNLNEERIG